MAISQHSEFPFESMPYGNRLASTLLSRPSRTGRSGRTGFLSRAWASVCIGLAALACAASLAWMLTAPDSGRDARSSALALADVDQRLLFGGLGAVASLAIGIIGILYWPPGGRPGVRGQETLLSTYDGMTGLPTRRLFLVLLAQALTRAVTTKRLVAVLVIELEHCRPLATSDKISNVTLVVRVQAARIKSALQTHDAVARLDERRFAVILDNLDSAERILAIVRTVHRTMALPFQIEGQELLLSCRMGGAIAPFDGTDGESLLDRASEMLVHSQTDDATIAFSSDPTTVFSAGPAAPNAKPAAEDRRRVIPAADR